MKGGPWRPPRALFGFVLDADLEPGSILQDLTVIAQVDIELIDFRHPQVPDGFRGFQNRVLRRRFPTVGLLPMISITLYALIGSSWVKLPGVRILRDRGEAS